MDDRARFEALSAIMREHDLDALTVRVGEARYELVRRDATVASMPVFIDQGSAQPKAPAATAADAQPSEHVRRVTAPVVGVFYRAPTPGAEPFVEVGDRVSVGQTICILEAMKLMNEITSDFAGVVTRVVPENGELVSLGEDLFWIE